MSAAALGAARFATPSTVASAGIRRAMARGGGGRGARGYRSATGARTTFHPLHEATPRWMQAVHGAVVLAVAGGVPLLYFRNSEQVPVTRRQRVMLLSPELELLISRHLYASVAQQLEDADEVRKYDADDGRKAEFFESRRTVQRMGKELAGLAGKVAPHCREWEWSFQLVATPMVNAFCAPGGEIVVTSGMVDSLRKKWVDGCYGGWNEDGEYESYHWEECLRFVMAHEVGHAIARHTSEDAWQLPVRVCVASQCACGRVNSAMPVCLPCSHVGLRVCAQYMAKWLGPALESVAKYFVYLPNSRIHVCCVAAVFRV